MADDMRRTSVEEREHTKDRAEFRKLLRDAEFTASRDFDKAIMTLAAGGLGVSLTLVGGIPGGPAPGSVGWLVAAWVLLTTSLVSIVLAYSSMGISIRAALTELTQGHDEHRERHGRFWNGVTAWLNRIAVATLLFGVIALIAFAVLNVERMTTLTQNRVKQPDHSGGWVLPPGPKAPEQQQPTTKPPATPPANPPAKPPAKPPATPTKK